MILHQREDMPAAARSQTPAASATVHQNTPVLYDRTGGTASRLAMYQLPLMARNHQLHLVFQPQFQFFKGDFLNQVFRIQVQLVVYLFQLGFAPQMLFRELPKLWIVGQ
jgi:hypothetical protein